MSQQELKSLPLRFDPVNFADHERHLHGSIDSKTMLRLLSNVEFIDPMITVNVSFSRGLYGYPLVTGQAKATVTIRCERCLDGVEMLLEPEISILVKPEDEDLPYHGQNNGLNRPEDSPKNMPVNSPEFFDYDGKILVLADLIEEELLLALPLVPKHQDISLCNQDMVVWLAANDVQDKGPETAVERAENPFATLKRVD